MKLENEPSFAKLLSSWPRITAWAGKWSILAPQWPIITHLKQSAYDALLPCKKRFQELDEMWRLKLRPLCGDSYEPDWQRFRPLRLSREVDWSDWLAWLLGTSATGHFAETIFGAFLNCNFISPKTEREEPKGQDCRADIVLQWKNGGQCTSVEVKVDDDNFEKTFETCGILERWKPGVRWTHTILLPEGAKDAWNATFPHRASIRVGMILWRDVAHGLRHSLWEGQEPVIWQAWALAFCRSVEVRLLGLSLPLPSNDGFQQLVMAARWNEILETSEAESNKDMKPEKKAFLREGVQLYAEAKDIVETFETQMVCLLKDTIDGQPSWMQGPIADKPKFCSTGEQRWLYTTIKGKCPLGKEASVECGIAWNVARQNNPIIYAGLWRENRQQRLSPPEGNESMGSFEHGGRDGSYLYLPIPSSLELEEPLNSLFDAILKREPKIASVLLKSDPNAQDNRRTCEE